MIILKKEEGANKWMKEHGIWEMEDLSGEVFFIRITFVRKNKTGWKVSNPIGKAIIEKNSLGNKIPEIMKYFVYSIILVLFLTTTSQSQENKIQFEFLPSGLNFPTLRANMQEAKIGVLYFTDNRNLKVDIGNNANLIKLIFPQNSISIASGIEFMGYALSTNYKEYRLQIDALDGFFGGNVSFKQKFKQNKLEIRLRIIHNSAHLVDGHYDFRGKFWINNDTSNHYTRNFLELTTAHQLYTNFGYFRYYGGGSYSFFLRPSNIKRMNLLAGFELAFRNSFGKVLKKDENIFIAEHFSLWSVIINIPEVSRLCSG